MRVLQNKSRLQENGPLYEKEEVMVPVTSRFIDELKILPRLAFLCQIILTWKCCLWYMEQGAAATTQMTTFVSIVTAMLSASFAIWVGKESNTDRSNNGAGK